MPFTAAHTYIVHIWQYLPRALYLLHKILYFHLYLSLEMLLDILEVDMQ